MNEQTLRLECLKLANSLYYDDENSEDRTLKAANKFYEFVTGIEQAKGQYSFHLGEQG